MKTFIILFMLGAIIILLYLLYLKNEEAASYKECTNQMFGVVDYYSNLCSKNALGSSSDGDTNYFRLCIDLQDDEPERYTVLSNPIPNRIDVVMIKHGKAVLIKSFPIGDDEGYALRCAEELLDKLNENP